MKILILHHVEPMWAEALEKHAGLSFAEYEEQIFTFLQENNFDKVILTRFEDHKVKAGEYSLLAPYINQVEEYAYGWERAVLEESKQYNSEIRYCAGGNHSEVVLIEKWQCDLINHDVYIAGCFDGECLEDLEIALDYCEVKYKRIAALIH